MLQQFLEQSKTTEQHVVFPPCSGWACTVTCLVKHRLCSRRALSGESWKRLRRGLAAIFNYLNRWYTWSSRLYQLYWCAATAAGVTVLQL